MIIRICKSALFFLIQPDKKTIAVLRAKYFFGVELIFTKNSITFSS